MFKPGRIIGSLVLVIALLAGGVLLGQRLAKEEPPVITAELIENRLEQITELGTVNYHYKNMGQFEDDSKVYGFTLPFTSKKFILAYSGEVKAGVDLRGLKVDVSGEKITIGMPEAEILSHEIDESSITVFDEKSSLFNPIKIEDMTTFQTSQKEEIENEVIEKGLLTQASESAKEIIRSMFMLDSEMFEGYQIIIK